jgi:hypothetical protein
MGLQLAERAVDMVADRQLARRVPLFRLGNGGDAYVPDFRPGRYENNLAQLSEEVSALLMLNFP